MPATATVTATGTAGPGLTVTAQVFSNVAQLDFDVPNAMLVMVDSSSKISRVSIAAATTVTITLSGAAGNYTVTVS